jgi:hypothetical protein
MYFPSDMKNLEVTPKCVILVLLKSPRTVSAFASSMAISWSEPWKRLYSFSWHSLQLSLPMYSAVRGGLWDELSAASVEEPRLQLITDKRVKTKITAPTSTFGTNPFFIAK